MRNINEKYVDERTVSRCIKRWKEESTIEAKKSTGRPKAIKPMTQKAMDKYIKSTKKEVNYRILKHKFKLNCNRRTVNKWGLENGYSKFV